MRHRIIKAVVTAVAVLAGAPAMAADIDRVVWKGAYTAPYHVAAECLARKMSGDFSDAVVTSEGATNARVRFWQDEQRRGEPIAHFLIQPSGDDRVEIGWRRAPNLPDAIRLDEVARNVAIECGGRSA